MNSRDLLRTLMERSGDNPNSLAQKTKVPQPTIFRFLSGTAKEPRTSTLEPIAKYYGVPVEVFFSDKAREDLVASWSAPGMKPVQNVGRTLKLLRLANGDHLDTVASETRIDSENLTAIEAGSEAPSPEILAALSKHFNVRQRAIETALVESIDDARLLLESGGRIIVEATQQQKDLYGEEPQYVGQVGGHQRRIPVVGAAQMGDNGFYEQLEYPVGHGSEYILTHSVDRDAYILEARGDSMKPAIRNGWYVLVEPNSQPMPGEYVVLQLTSGQKMIKELLFLNRRGDVEVMSVNGSTRISLESSQVACIQAVAGIFPPSQVHTY